jgi:hypothetical protein
LKTIDAKDLQMAALPGHRACMMAEPMAAQTAALRVPRTAALRDGLECTMAAPTAALVTAEPTAAAMAGPTAEHNRKPVTTLKLRGTATCGRRPFFALVQF